MTIGTTMLFKLGFGLYGLAFILAILIPNDKWSSRVSHILSALGSLAWLILSLFTLYTRRPFRFKLLSGVVSLPFTIDVLSSVFLFLFSAVFFFISIYSLRYVDLLYVERSISVRLYGVMFPVFLASMIAVILVRSGLWLLVFWELMTLSSYILVSFEHWRSEVRRAGLIYFALCHVATALMIIVILRLASILTPVSFLYPDLARGASSVGLYERTALSILFAIAMGIKCGIVPLHFWVYRAYPAAPSPITALMAGVMDKVPIFLLLYFTFKIFAPSIALGVVVFILGILSMIIGGLYAIPQNDVKRLLAYSTICQIGYMWFAFGVGFMAYTYGGDLALLGTLLIAAGLFHMLNHMLFEPILFMSSGVLEVKAGTCNMDLLGGFSRILPLTAIATATGVLSAIGIPIFNGFASKWCIYVCGLSISRPSYLAVLSYIGVILAVFSGTLTAIYSIKLYSEVFQGSPKITVRRGEPSYAMAIPQILLSIPCVFLGVLPVFAFKYLIFPASSKLTGIPAAELAEALRLKYSIIAIPPGVPVSTLYFLLISILIPIFFIIALLLIFPVRARLDEAWACGFTHAVRELKFPSSSLYSAFEDLLKPLYALKFKAVRIFYGEPKGDVVVVEPWIYIGSGVGEVRRVQVGRVQIYVAVFLVMFILALILGVIMI